MYFLFSPVFVFFLKISSFRFLKRINYKKELCLPLPNEPEMVRQKKKKMKDDFYVLADGRLASKTKEYILARLFFFPVLVHIEMVENYSLSKKKKVGGGAV